MSYQNYVIAAYAVFGLVMLWDYIAPRIAIRQQLRAARLRASRVQVRAKDDGLPLSALTPELMNSLQAAGVFDDLVVRRS